MKRKQDNKIWPSHTGIWIPNFWSSSRPKFKFGGRLDRFRSQFLKNLDFIDFFFLSVFSWRSWTRNVGVMFVFSCCKLSISFLRISEMRPQFTICCQITMSIRLLFTNLTFLTKKLWLTTFHSSKLCLSGKNNLHRICITES